MQEIFERRFRWTVRQVLSAVADARSAGAESRAGRGRSGLAPEVRERLAGLESFFSVIDAGIGAFVRGEPFPAEKLRSVIPLQSGRTRSG
jgi:hypothetical protein